MAETTIPTRIRALPGDDLLLVCPTCGAPPHETCRNYKGGRKPACRARRDLARLLVACACCKGSGSTCTRIRPPHYEPCRDCGGLGKRVPSARPVRPAPLEVDDQLGLFGAVRS